MAFHPLVKDSEGWRTLESEETFANPYVAVARVRLETPSRPGGVEWTVVHRKAGCIVAPLTADGRFLLIRQERIPVRAILWEFPSGQIDIAEGHTEEIRQENALRELREESGYHLGLEGNLVPMGLYYPSCGFTDETTYLYMARGVVPSPEGVQYDEHEAILECRAFTPAELRQMIAQGEICDANTLAAFARMTALQLFPQA